MAEEETDPLLCVLESMKITQTIGDIQRIPEKLRMKRETTSFHIETLERSLKIIEKSCGIKFDESWKTLDKAKEWIEKKDVSMAILVLDRIKRKMGSDIIKQFE